MDRPHRLTVEQAAIVIQRALRARRAAKVDPAMRAAEYTTLRARHRHQLEAKEREFLFLQKLPGDAVLRLALKKQEQAATKFQALWRGYKVRKQFPQLKEETDQAHAAVRIQRAYRSHAYKPPIDTFYGPIDLARMKVLWDRIATRMHGAGDHERYMDEYSQFLRKQVAWEALRQQRVAHLDQSRKIVHALVEKRTLMDPLHYHIPDPTSGELARAHKMHETRILSGKKWWKRLDLDEWEEDLVSGSILDDIDNYRLDLYRSRNFKYA